ncbi:MAG: hypothetical protein G01um101430_79 [Parcubacteria group bacterium Gr01-1014_30]|nr:MAG: hypothetical protein G01um101430_79 [Parcubacteria group bacterium Gr01-1014_30]
MEWAIIAIVVGLIVYLLLGLQAVQEEERRVVELFGSYWNTLTRGLNLILPGIMRIRASVRISDQRIPLWETGAPKIDFKDGSATPVGAEAFVRIMSPDYPYEAFYGELPEDMASGIYRAVYRVADWRVAARDQLESALRAHLTSLSLDDGLTSTGAGSDLINKVLSDNLARTLALWGLELRKLSIMDFELPQEIVQARGEVQIRRRQAEAALHVREQRARETVGTVVQMLAEATGRDFAAVQAEIGASVDLQSEVRRLSEDLIKRRMSLDGRALTDIRLEGGGDLGGALAQLIALMKVQLGSSGEPSPPGEKKAGRWPALEEEAKRK